MADAPFHGLGLFVRHLPPNEIEHRVRRMADRGITWVSVGTTWQDLDRDTGAPTQRWINSPVNCRRIIKACDKCNLKVSLWGYPCRGRETEFAEDLRSCATPSVLASIPDPELRSKATDDNRNRKIDPPELQRAYADARALYWAITKVNPYWHMLITSYGIPAGHPTLPWDAFFAPENNDYLGEATGAVPQLYDEDLDDMRRGLQQYRDLGADMLIPGYGTYRFSRDSSGKRITPSMTGRELDEHLGRLMSLRDEFGFNAMIGWSEVQVTSGAWAVIEKYAALFASSDGACGAPTGGRASD